MSTELYMGFFESLSCTPENNTVTTLELKNTFNIEVAF